MFLSVAALGVIITDLLGGFLFLAAAALVLPPVNRWLKATFNLALSAKAKAWLVLGFLLAGSLAMARGVTRGEEREAARAAEARAEALRADFKANGSAILARMDTAFKARNYSLAVSFGEKYAAVVADSQLARRLRDARAAQRHANYKATFNDDSTRMRRRESAEQAVEQGRIRRFGPVPQASAWDGTYREVKDYLQQVANDPDRLKMEACTPVYHVANGWLVGCDYRGANAFGGIIRQSNWFIIRNGRVVEMKESSAYRP